MGSNTITYTVKDLVDLGIIEKPLDGNHGGIHPKSSDYVEYGVPFIMASDLINGHVDVKGCKFITEEQAKSLRKGFAKEGDVLLSHKATIGRTAIVGELPTDFIVLTPQITYYRVLDFTRLNSRYLKYYFDSEAFQALFEQWAGGGSTRLYLGITEQMKLPIELPEITIQNKIVDLVDSFDRKITLNRQINQTLEQMAQALFKSWFVDFDPVVDNALDACFFEQDLAFPDELLRRAEARRAVRESGDFRPLPDATRQLFPAAFEECAEPSLGLGGWVPKGWAVSELSELIDIKHGFAFKGEYFSDSETDEILLTPGNVAIGGGFKPDKYKYYAGPIEENYIFSPGDIFVTMTDLSKASDTLGYPAIVPEITGKRFHHNQRLGKVIFMAHPASCAMFIYHTLCSTPYRQYVLGGATGTTVKHTAPKKILSHKLVNSLNGLAEAEFERLVANYNLMVSENHKASRTLTRLRDTLLPELISGELRLDKIETELAEEGVE